VDYRDMFALRGSYFGQFSSGVDRTTGAETGLKMSF